MMQPYFSASSTNCGSGAMSPSMENTPSVISSLWHLRPCNFLQNLLASLHVFVRENLEFQRVTAGSHR
jgi:hypothetical protein